MCSIATLFNLYTETIFRYINNMKDITVGGRNINTLSYAGDTALLAENEVKLQNLLNVIKEKCLGYGLSMNVKKTKVMVISKEDTVPRAHILLNGECLEQVNQFTYLGQVIRDDGYCDTDIRRRIGVAQACFTKMKNILVPGKIKPGPASETTTMLCVVNTLLWGRNMNTQEGKLSNNLKPLRCGHTDV